MLINFTNFLAKEMIEESERIRKNTVGEGSIIEEQNTEVETLLYQMIDKNTNEFENNKENFNMDAFAKE